jgi:hypothetical protein
VKAAYKAAGAPEGRQLVRYDQGHFENRDMHQRILEFLNRWM